ncbi:MAG: VWA domain-containing protein [Chloroflexi bacterium]|nr:VWA domain-containing protein [Chloroflexota bacterium]
MGKSNQVGFLTFGDGIIARVPIAPLDANRFPIAGAIEEMQARGNTALYDAIKTGIEMTDAAPGDPDATRGIVVLTDGKANRGRTQLHDLIQMMSRNEVAVREFRGFEADDEAVLEEGAKAGKKELMGTGLALKTRHRILVFYIGDDDPATSPAPPVRPPEDTPRSPPPDGPVNGHATGRQPDRDYPSGLTRREFEVLRLVDRGA